MSDVPILRAEHHWVCPMCTATHVTHESLPHTPFHSCRGMRLLTVPFVPDGTNCKMVALERDDYIGRESVQTDAEGRPVMQVVTTRDEGQDCTVYAPSATVMVG